jgi:hypothetical protein
MIASKGRLGSRKNKGFFLNTGGNVEEQIDDRANTSVEARTACLLM